MIHASENGGEELAACRGGLYICSRLARRHWAGGTMYIPPLSPLTGHVEIRYLLLVILFKSGRKG